MQEMKETRPRILSHRKKWAEAIWNKTAKTIRLIHRWTSFEPRLERNCPHYTYALKHPEVSKPDDSVRRLSQLHARLKRDALNGKELLQRGSTIKKWRGGWTPSLGTSTVVFINAGFIAYLIYYSWDKGSSLHRRAAGLVFALQRRTGRVTKATSLYSVMFSATAFFRLRLCFFTIASVLNIVFAVLLTHRTVAHSDICWWLFCLETIGLSYYSLVELWLNRFNEGRLSLLGIIGSAVATQGVLSNSVDPTVSRILMLLAVCNLGFIFSIGLRIKTTRTAIPTNKLTKDKLNAYGGGDSACTEITPEEVPMDDKIDWATHSETSSGSFSVTSETPGCCISRELFSLGLGIAGLSVGLFGWILNFSSWIKECLDKDTCSELGPQWWSLGQSLLFFLMYVLAVALSRTFEVLAAYSVLVSIPVSVFLRVANTARTDFFYLKNQENAYETWDSVGTVIGSSLIATAGALLITSLGSLHFSWKSPAPENTRSFRATLSLIGILGVVIFGVGLHSVQHDVCKRQDPLCDWYDGLWVEMCLEIVIVLLGVLSVFGQPGESVRAMLIALATIPSFTYTINSTNFLEMWNSDNGLSSSDSRWEIRFSASGLILLSIVNYLWMLAWGWGRSECLDLPKEMRGCEPGLTKRLLKTVRSLTGGRRKTQTLEETEGLEMGRMNGHAPL